MGLEKADDRCHDRDESGPREHTERPPAQALVNPVSGAAGEREWVSNRAHRAMIASAPLQGISSGTA